MATHCLPLQKKIDVINFRDKGRGRVHPSLYQDPNFIFPKPQTVSSNPQLLHGRRTTLECYTIGPSDENLGLRLARHRHRADPTAAKHVFLWSGMLRQVLRCHFFFVSPFATNLRWSTVSVVRTDAFQVDRV